MTLKLACTLAACAALPLPSPLAFTQAPATPAAVTTPPARRPIVLDDLAKLLRVGAPQLSPDGAWIAYTVSSIDPEEDKSVSQLWMVSWDGTQHVQLTFGKDSVGSPRWSPDGHFLAFTSSREGSAKGSQVWLFDRRGGEPQQLTALKENLGGFRWSPDSKQLLLTLQTKDQPEPEKGAKPLHPQPIVLDRFHFKEDIEGYLSSNLPHLFLFDIAARKLAKLTAAPLTGPKAFAEEYPEYSPDGRQVAFISNQSAPDPDRVNNSDVFVTPALPGSTPRQLTTFTGRDEAPLAWTPDSRRVIYRQGISPKYSIYDMPLLMAVPAAGGTPTPLAPNLDQWPGAPVTAGPNAILTTVQQDRNTFLARVPLDGKAAPTRLTPDPGSLNAFDFAAGHTVLLWSTDAAPPELYALEENRSGNSLRKLTTHNDAWLAALNLAPTEDLSATTSDHSEVHSLLTLPLGYTPGTKAPMILFIHGGPTSQDAHGFSLERQLLAAHGYAVLNVNYRGSTGRGHAYSEAINADWGHKEVLDLLAATDAAIATGHIDPDRMGVGGWSYGGILTDYIIASTPRFKAASSGAGMGNLLGFYGVDEYILQYENELGPPWKNLDAYIKLSYPFLHADRISTPTLFMGGDQDFNVPLTGSEQMFQALKSVGTPAQLIVYPGQFHGLTRPSFIRDRYQRWFNWYDQYVRGILPAPPVPPPATPTPKA